MGEPLDRFQGKVVRRGDDGYDLHRYQYAFSSYRDAGTMEPAAVLRPASTRDVLLALEHAAKNSLAIALRTGGHHHSGGSSTNGPNLLLDLRTLYREFEWDPARDRVRVGVGHSLETFNALLGERGLFVPHGQCSHVCLGGHAQTGGYGMLARSFGLFSDYIESIELVTADGRQRVVRRDSDDPDDRDLFFATLGGSPGSFGILTHVTFRPLHDRDHPNARGLKFLMPYSRRRLEALLDFVVEMSSDEDLAADWDVIVMALGGAQLQLPFASARIDERMRVHHPEVYGRNQLAALPTSIVVYAQWANTDGARQRYDPALFQRIKSAAGYGSSPWGRLIEAAQNRVRIGRSRLGVSCETPRPLSELMSHWLFLNAREFDLPYVKRAWLSNSTSLARTRWAAWLAERFDALVSGDNGCKGFLSVQHLGGRRSRFRTLGADGATAHSWRADSTVVCLLDCYYDEHRRCATPPRQHAIEWQATNDEGALGRKLFSDEDRRLFFGPWGDTDLGEVWPRYLDSRAKYDRLLAIKRRVDPAGVFSANSFGVGYRPRAPASR